MNTLGHTTAGMTLLHDITAKYNIPAVGHQTEQLLLTWYLKIDGLPKETSHTIDLDFPFAKAL
jgi:hypothetical protein